jgi:hypothetical protein
MSVFLRVASAAAVAVFVWSLQATNSKPVEMNKKKFFMMIVLVLLFKN